MDLNKIIDNICWWIPFKKLRNNIKDLLLLFNKELNDNLILNQNLLFINLNKLKELDLKQKIKDNKKVKVLFYINRSSQFGLDIVYELMDRSNFFDPYILVANSRDYLFNCDNRVWKEFIDDYNFFKNKGYKILSAYNLNTKIFIPLEEFNPDIIFFHDPWVTVEQTIFNNINMNIKYLTCYVNYGFNIVENYNAHYNFNSINYSWKNYISTREDYVRFTENKKSYASNTVLTGRAKLDLYMKDINECIIPKKIDNGKKIVIIAPHWTLGIDNKSLKSTFDLYYKYFMNLLKTYKDINFVFKPHPNLLYRIKETNIIDYNEYLEYLEEWNNSENGICITSGEYIDLFMKSSCLITDSGSFIAEYLPSKKPCIYLINPTKPDMFDKSFTNFAKKILNTYYLSYSEEDISKYFNQIIFNNIDDKKDARLKVLNEEFVNLGTASNAIFNDIKRSLGIDE